MFTKEDYIDYFREIEIIENQMLQNVLELKALIKDDDIRKILDKIHADEEKHIGLEEKVIKSITDTD